MTYHSKGPKAISLKLTLQEFKVYMLIVERAYSDREISDHFKISRETVNDHKRKIFDKMGVFSKLELLVQYHRREGNIK